LLPSQSGVKHHVDPSSYSHLLLDEPQESQLVFLIILPIAILLACYTLLIVQMQIPHLI